MKTFDPGKMTLQGFENEVRALMEHVTSSQEVVELIHQKFSPMPDMEVEVINEHSFRLAFHVSFLDGEDQFQIIFSSIEEEPRGDSKIEEEEGGVPSGYYLERNILHRLH